MNTKAPKKEVKKNTQDSLTQKVPSVSYYGTGKRKSAIAKTWVFEGSGRLIINKKEAEDYLSDDLLVQLVKKPLDTLKLSGKYDVVISALGGGIVGQATACQLGVARALLKLNPEFRGALKAAGYLTRDPRVKERKKYGRKKARKGFQFRKR